TFFPVEKIISSPIISISPLLYLANVLSQGIKTAFVFNAGQWTSCVNRTALPFDKMRTHSRNINPVNLPVRNHGLQYLAASGDVVFKGAARHL
ncbi:MAG: hypothetical protein V2B18_24570, partial [Pseudomonadota bacterium]